MTSRWTARTSICFTVTVVSCLALAGLGCDISSSGTDKKERRKELEKQRLIDESEGPDKSLEQQARQIVADRYRGRIEPGFGCDQCPRFCALLDLRAPDPDELRQSFRQAILDSTSDDPLARRIGIYEHNRVTCILNLHASMRDVLGPLLDAREHSRVRYEVAVIAIAFELPAGDPRRVLHELAEGSDETARHARGLIQFWDQEGWPDGI